MTYHKVRLTKYSFWRIYSEGKVIDTRLTRAACRRFVKEMK